MKEKISTNAKLDYITATSPLEAPTNNLLVGPLSPVGSLKPLGRYDTAIELQCGGRVDRAENGHLAGYRIQLTGSNLEMLRESGKPDDFLLADVMRYFWTVTRLDGAVDVSGAGKVAHVVNHWKSGAVNTRLSPDDYHHRIDDSPAATLYFGSKKSDNRVRIYNKSAQLGLLNIALLRIENQRRGKPAAALAAAVLEFGTSASVRSAIRKTIDCPHLRWWQVAMTGGDVEIPPARRNDSDFLRWLNTQVKPAILKHAESPSEFTDIDRWTFQIRAELLEIGALRRKINAG